MFIDDSQIGAHDDATANNEKNRSTTVLYQLTTGQTVHVATDVGAYGDTSYFRSYFSGFLLLAN